MLSLETKMAEYIATKEAEIRRLEEDRAEKQGELDVLNEFEREHKLLY